MAETPSGQIIEVMQQELFRHWIQVRREAPVTPHPHAYDRVVALVELFARLLDEGELLDQSAREIMRAWIESTLIMSDLAASETAGRGTLLALLEDIQKILASD